MVLRTVLLLLSLKPLVQSRYSDSILVEFALPSLYLILKLNLASFLAY